MKIKDINIHTVIKKILFSHNDLEIVEIDYKTTLENQLHSSLTKQVLC